MVRIWSDAEIASRSFYNCHARGLFGLLLAPGLRAFVAMENHELWDTGVWHAPLLGYHGHRHRLRLQATVGSPMSHHIRRAEDGADVNVFRWDSHILGGAGAFSRVGADRVVPCGAYPMDRLELGPDDLHTVIVPRGEPAAWLVRELDPANDFDPLVYTSRDLSGWDSSEMYQPVTSGQVWALMETYIGRSDTAEAGGDEG